MKWHSNTFQVDQPIGGVSASPLERDNTGGAADNSDTTASTTTTTTEVRAEQETDMAAQKRVSVQQVSGLVQWVVRDDGE